ncbi:MAG: cob(I)yrinic acid a,c-diamide adenosyltransferase [Paludibacter sp.]|nr:cob(I)yrinic acid a,c-diamide adenosyltransferase [Paludibacter sp.]
MKGYIQVYTGNGKGKTTAALGLAVRALGAGKKVFIGQFAKSKHYSELETIDKLLKSITIKQFGMGCFIFEKPKEEDVLAAQKGLKEIADIIESDEYDVIILDEANIAVYYNLFSVEELIQVISQKSEKTEIIITGRYATQEIMDFADLVTEMKEIKHYYQQGVQARIGIEK